MVDLPACFVSHYFFPGTRHIRRDDVQGPAQTDWSTIQTGIEGTSCTATRRVGSHFFSPQEHPNDTDSPDRLWNSDVCAMVNDLPAILESGISSCIIYVGSCSKKRFF